MTKSVFSSDCFVLKVNMNVSYCFTKAGGVTATVSPESKHECINIVSSIKDGEAARKKKEID